MRISEIWQVKKRATGVRSSASKRVALTLILLCIATRGTYSAKVRGQTAVTTRDLATLRDIGGTQAGLSVSPSGRSIVFNLRQGDPDRNEYRNEWIILNVATKKHRVLVEDAGPPLLSYGDGLPPVDDYNQGIQAFSPVWTLDEKKVFYVRKDHEGIRLYAVDTSNGRSAPVELPLGKVIGLKDEGGAARVTLEVQSPGALETVRHLRIGGALFTGNEFSPVKGIPTFRTPTELRTVRMDLSTGAISKPLNPEQDACEAFPGWPRDQDLTFMFGDCVFDPQGRPVAVGTDLRKPRESMALYMATSG
ncbi:MAG: hypothetical protein AB1649_34485, partial [Chloroflexota bacterium]